MAGSPSKDQAQLTLLEEETPDLSGFDSSFRAEYGVVCGIDEAGRGPLAGDVFAAAVVFDEGTVIEGVNDSKKLTKKRREALFDEICSKARAYCIASASVDEIERLNILQADFLAMQRAYKGLGIKAGIVLVDGNQLPELDTQMKYVIKGDARSASIAAASILAKVSRDRYMKQMAEKYPQYGFDKHKGYGTKAHYAAVDEFGLCEIHRRSFFKKYFEKNAAHG
ncbi:MAG: ribonuclease HII [Oscillospiraceae bacterium]|nr:ribonuclease HII [Oscillospiraceae bacterium]